MLNIYWWKGRAPRKWAQFLTISFLCAALRLSISSDRIREGMKDISFSCLHFGMTGQREGRAAGVVGRDCSRTHITHKYNLSVLMQGKKNYCSLPQTHACIPLGEALLCHLMQWHQGHPSWAKAVFLDRRTKGERNPNTCWFGLPLVHRQPILSLRDFAQWKALPRKLLSVLISTSQNSDRFFLLKHQKLCSCHHLPLRTTVTLCWLIDQEAAGHAKVHLLGRFIHSLAAT